MADDLCQCPKCGRVHRDLGFGKPPESISSSMSQDDIVANLIKAGTDPVHANWYASGYLAGSGALALQTLATRACQKVQIEIGKERDDARATATAQAKTIEGLERQIEIRKQAAARHQVCSGHSGKQPTDGECIMCFAERHEAVRNRLDAKHELDRWKEETEATATAQAAEVERLTGEVAKLKQFPSGDFDEEVARLIRCLQLPDVEADGFIKACTDAANMLESLEWGNVDLRQGLATAESSLETARAALENLAAEFDQTAQESFESRDASSEIKARSRFEARGNAYHSAADALRGKIAKALPQEGKTK